MTGKIKILSKSKKEMRALAKKGRPFRPGPYNLTLRRWATHHVGHAAVPCIPADWKAVCKWIHVPLYASQHTVVQHLQEVLEAHGRSTPSRSARLSEQLRCTGGRARLLTPPSSLEVDPNSGVSSSKSPDKGLCVTFHTTTSWKFHSKTRESTVKVQ